MMFGASGMDDLLALFQAAEAEGMSPGDMVKATGLTAGQIGYKLGNLIRQGLVEYAGKGFRVDRMKRMSSVPLYRMVKRDE